MGDENIPPVDPELLPPMPHHTLGWLLAFDGALGVLGIFSAIAQVACLIHVYRTGRPYWWFWVILWFPVVGVGAYLLFELRPGWGKINWRSILWKLKSRAERIRILREQLEDSSTVSNRLLLAEELFAAGRYDEVCELLSDGLRGAFATDAEMLLQLAEAHLTAGRIDAAEAALARMEDERSRDVQFRRKLLEARILAQRGEVAAAEPRFRALLSPNRSEAPRYYLGDMLITAGRREEGERLLRQILDQYRSGTAVWRAHEREWQAAARNRLKQR